MNKSIRLLLTLAAMIALPAGAAEKATIKKCQDATGKWHYGDSAADACARAKITVMSEYGVTKKQIDAPLTDDQLKQRDQQVEESAKEKEQKKKDELLLATYSLEADITYIRDRKIAQLDSAIRASTDTLSPLRATLGRLEAQAASEGKSGAVSEQTTAALAQTRGQIAKHESAIAQRRQEQEQVRTRATEDLARYRVLKAQPQKTAAEAAKR
jgi:hypothetical protein